MLKPRSPTGGHSKAVSYQRSAASNQDAVHPLSVKGSKGEGSDGLKLTSDS